jgi:hypothetical protein
VVVELPAKFVREGKRKRVPGRCRHRAVVVGTKGLGCWPAGGKEGQPANAENAVLTVQREASDAMAALA